MGLPVHHMIMLGARGVGKTALVLQLIQTVFDDYEPDVQNFRKQVCVDEIYCMLDILDPTDFCNSTDSIRERDIRRNQGFMLVYDSVASAEVLITMYDELVKVKETQSPMVVVATKCDLQREDQVAQKGRELAKHWNVPFFEASAKERMNVDESYFELIRQIRALHPHIDKKKSNCCLQ